MPTSVYNLEVDKVLQVSARRFVRVEGPGCRDRLPISVSAGLPTLSSLIALTIRMRRPSFGNLPMCPEQRFDGRKS
jgi:hypothetical protein